MSTGHHKNHKLYTCRNFTSNSKDPHPRKARWNRSLFMQRINFGTCLFPIETSDRLYCERFTLHNEGHYSNRYQDFYLSYFPSRNKPPSDRLTKNPTIAIAKGTNPLTILFKHFSHYLCVLNAFPFRPHNKVIRYSS